MPATLQTACLRIAHLTDIHLPPLPRFRIRHWNVKRGLGYANWQRKRQFIHTSDALRAIIAHLKAQSPDHVIVSGDLINIGLPEEYRAALAWLLELGAPADVSVVPGNHDIYTPLWTESGVGRWQAFMTGEPLPQLHRGTQAFPFVRTLRRGPSSATLIGLNSARPTPPGVAWGVLGKRQRQDLAHILDWLRNQRQFRLVAVHHPPLPRLAGWRKGLRDSNQLEAMLSGHGAELVVFGHNHVVSETWIDGPDGAFPVIGAGSASTAVQRGEEPAASYHLFEIAPSPGEALWRVRWQRFGLARGLPGPVEKLLDRTFDVPRRGP
ncbi:MAG: metallophosphoesterase family protein [Hyphomicrobiaceae bacterium]